MFYAERYLPWQETVLKILEEIGFNEEFKINEPPVQKLKAIDSLKPVFANAMKFASFIAEEVEEEKSLSPLQTEVPFNEKEIILSNQAYIFADMKLENIEVVEKDAPCTSTTAETK